MKKEGWLSHWCVCWVLWMTLSSLLYHKFVYDLEQLRLFLFHLNQVVVPLILVELGFLFFFFLSPDSTPPFFSPIVSLYENREVVVSSGCCEYRNVKDACKRVEVAEQMQELYRVHISYRCGHFIHGSW